MCAVKYVVLLVKSEEEAMLQTIVQQMQTISGSLFLGSFFLSLSLPPLFFLFSFLFSSAIFSAFTSGEEKREIKDDNGKECKLVKKW